MNQLIQQQLKKVQFDLPTWDENTEELFIKKRGPEDPSIIKSGRCYIIQVPEYIVNPPDGFTLNSNWNKGLSINDYILYVEINKVMGKMIQFTGRGFDYKNKTTNNNFYNQMWLPMKSIQILDVL